MDYMDLAVRCSRKAVKFDDLLTTSVDAVAPYVVRSPTVLMLLTLDTQVFVLFDEGLQWCHISFRE